MSDKLPLRALPMKGPGPVLVCRKCLKRMDDGGKLKSRLKASLKQRSAGRKEGRARLVLASCFGICPKNAVVTASVATFARGEFLLIRGSSDDAIEQASAALIDASET